MGVVRKTGWMGRCTWNEVGKKRGGSLTLDQQSLSGPWSGFVAPVKNFQSLPEKEYFTSHLLSSKRFVRSKMGKNLICGFAAYCVICSEVVSQSAKTEKISTNLISLNLVTKHQLIPFRHQCSWRCTRTATSKSITLKPLKFLIDT